MKVKLQLKGQRTSVKKLGHSFSSPPVVLNVWWSSYPSFPWNSTWARPIFPSTSWNRFLLV